MRQAPPIASILPALKAIVVKVAAEQRALQAGGIEGNTSTETYMINEHNPPGIAG
jgi:hypothetical protein